MTELRRRVADALASTKPVYTLPQRVADATNCIERASALLASAEILLQTGTYADLLAAQSLMQEASMWLQ